MVAKYMHYMGCFWHSCGRARRRVRLVVPHRALKELPSNVLVLPTTALTGKRNLLPFFFTEQKARGTTVQVVGSLPRDWKWGLDFLLGQGSGISPRGSQRGSQVLRKGTGPSFCKDGVTKIIPVAGQLAIGTRFMCKYSFHTQHAPPSVHPCHIPCPHIPSTHTRHFHAPISLPCPYPPSMQTTPFDAHVPIPVLLSDHPPEPDRLRMHRCRLCSLIAHPQKWPAPHRVHDAAGRGAAGVPHDHWGAACGAAGELH